MTNTAHDHSSTTTSGTSDHSLARRCVLALLAAGALAALTTGCLDPDDPEVAFLENGITISPNSPVPPQCSLNGALGEYMIPVGLNDTTGRVPGTFDPNGLADIHVGRYPLTNDARALMPLAGPTPTSAMGARLCFYVNQVTGAQNVVAGHVGLPLGTVSNVTGPHVLAAGWNAVNITPIVNDWIFGLHPNNGIGLREQFGGPNFEYRINSADHVFNQPFVIITP